MIEIAPVVREHYTLPKGKVSFSSLRLWNQCAECWKRQYVDGESGRVGISLPFGGSVHEGVSWARTDLMYGREITGTSISMATACAAEALERELGLIEPHLLDMGATRYKTGYDAKDDVVRCVQVGIDRILPDEARRGIVAVEARPDFGSLFPFALDGYIDVILAGPTLTFKDLKTSKDKREPDTMGKVQLRLYSLPWHLAGQSVELQIDTIVKPGTNVFHTEVSAEGPAFQAARQWVLATAGQISDAMKSGDFPATPSWSCRYVHALSAA